MRLNIIEINATFQNVHFETENKAVERTDIIRLGDQSAPGASERRWLAQHVAPTIVPTVADYCRERIAAGCSSRYRL